MNTHLNPNAIKNSTIPADKLSNTIIFKFSQTLDESNSVFLPDENYKEHNWEVIQKFNESYISGNGGTDIYYITLLVPKDDVYITTHERYTGQIHIVRDELIVGLMFNEYSPWRSDVVKYKGVACDIEAWIQETKQEVISDLETIREGASKVRLNNIAKQI